MRRYLDATFASLATRNFRLFVFGQTISQVGSWMQKMAQAWLVLELTDSGAWLGVVVAIQSVPTLLFGAWAGVLADRHHKRTLLIWTAVAGAVPAALLGGLCLIDEARIEFVLVLALVVGLVEAIEKPARQSLPSELVKAEHLTNAVTLANVVANCGKAIGPAIAGLLISGVGLSFTFFLNAISFAAVVWSQVAMNPADMMPSKRVARGGGQVRAGLKYVRSTRELVGPLVLLATTGILVYNFQVLLPLLARDTFDGDARAVGLLLGSLGVGSIIGGLALAGILGATLRRVIWSALVVAAAVGATGLAPTFALAIVAVFVLGACTITFRTLTSTWLQLNAEPSMRGRVMALLIIALGGSNSIGGPLMGWLAETVGPRATFVFASVGTALATAGVAFYLHRTSAREPVHLSNRPATNDVVQAWP